MKIDDYGRQILTENDLCDLFLKNPQHIIKNALVDKELTIPESLEIKTHLDVTVYEPLDMRVSKFDKMNQRNWYIPESYKDFDIAKYVLDLCQTEEELQRVGDELIKFQERDMFPLLVYCKYLVDTMRQHNIVWGVGRGSSVSSYVLYLIGIHKINSIHYDLSIDEFLK
jgi:DNA polymerase III alpha subunit